VVFFTINTTAHTIPGPRALRSGILPLDHCDLPDNASPIWKFSGPVADLDLWLFWSKIMGCYWNISAKFWSRMNFRSGFIWTWKGRTDRRTCPRRFHYVIRPAIRWNL